MTELNEITRKVKEKITKRIRIILELCNEFFVSKNINEYFSDAIFLEPISDLEGKLI